MIRHEVNKDRSLLHVNNFLIACEIMSLEETRPMFRAFHSRGEDIVVDIPDELDSRFMEALDAVIIRYEKL
jgi:hypothetical protein